MRCSAPSRVLAAQRCGPAAKNASTSLPPQAAPKAAPPHTDVHDAAPLSRRAALGAVAALLACTPHAARFAKQLCAFSAARTQADTRARRAQTALKRQRRCCSWLRWRPRCLQARAFLLVVASPSHHSPDATRNRLRRGGAARGSLAVRVHRVRGVGRERARGAPQGGPGKGGHRALPARLEGLAPRGGRAILRRGRGCVYDACAGVVRVC